MGGYKVEDKVGDMWRNWFCQCWHFGKRRRSHWDFVPEPTRRLFKDEVWDKGRTDFIAKIVIAI